MRVIFLDRDGVINEYPGDGKYVTAVKDFKVMAGSVQAIRKLHERGFKLYVVSNQGGVAKGLYTEKDLEKMNKIMIRELKKHSAALDGIFYCLHRIDDGCDCRKPRIGLLKQAVPAFNPAKDTAIFIGDSFMDMKAAREFGAKAVLVLSGREKISNRKNWEFEPDYIFDNLLIAAHYLCSHYGQEQPEHFGTVKS